MFISNYAECDKSSPGRKAESDKDEGDQKKIEMGRKGKEEEEEHKAEAAKHKKGKRRSLVPRSLQIPTRLNSRPST